MGVIEIFYPGRSGLVEDRHAGPVYGEDGSDRQPAVGSDMMAMGLADLLNQSVATPVERRRSREHFVIHVQCEHLPVGTAFITATCPL